MFVLAALNIYGWNFHCDKSRESSYGRYIGTPRTRIANAFRKLCSRLPFPRDSIPDANFGWWRCNDLSFFNRNSREDLVLRIQEWFQRQFQRQQITCHDTFSYCNPIACYIKDRVTRDYGARAVWNASFYSRGFTSLCSLLLDLLLMIAAYRS